MRTDLPAGTVTSLFTDVEGSTRLLHELGADAYGAALAEHRRIIRAACGPRGGVEVDTQGDSLFVAFGSASDAILAAQAITESFDGGRSRSGSACTRGRRSSPRRDTSGRTCTSRPASPRPATVAKSS